MSILLTLLWRLAVARGGWRWRCVLRETEVRSAVAGDWRWLAVAGGGVASCERQRCGRRWLATGGSSRWLVVALRLARDRGGGRRSAVAGGSGRLVAADQGWRSLRSADVWWEWLAASSPSRMPE
nr:hypothetical protein Iba_chr07aCG14780 [Ipomoea batatas]